MTYNNNCTLHLFSPTKSPDVAWLVVTEKGRYNSYYFLLLYVPFTCLWSQSKQWQCNIHTSLHSVPKMHAAQCNWQQTAKYTNWYLIMMMKYLQCKPGLATMFPHLQTNNDSVAEMVVHHFCHFGSHEQYAV